MNDRLRELILYIAQEMERDSHAGRGRVKLAKLVWRSDFAAYWSLGESITGATYVVDQLGPKPELEYSLTQQMIADGDLKWDSGFDQAKVPVALRDPDLSQFSAQQIAVVDRQLTDQRNVSAGSMVAESHQFAGYKHAAKHGRDTEIPYESVFWANTDDGLEGWEQEHAQSLAVAA